IRVFHNIVAKYKKVTDFISMLLKMLKKFVYLCVITCSTTPLGVVEQAIAPLNAFLTDTQECC
ncbi:MAG: hypothetical protein DSM106950_46205, partial [Stigonema ocellatum SAG 48.90 = DSM 106950]|nr:hypothetical protein [Stigonema ocellatum SAG 48.90 = DSM 106950]